VKHGIGDEDRIIAELPFLARDVGNEIAGFAVQHGTCGHVLWTQAHRDIGVHDAGCGKRDRNRSAPAGPHAVDPVIGKELLEQSRQPEPLSRHGLVDLPRVHSDRDPMNVGFPAFRTYPPGIIHDHAHGHAHGHARAMTHRHERSLPALGDKKFAASRRVDNTEHGHTLLAECDHHRPVVAHAMNLPTTLHGMSEHDRPVDLIDYPKAFRIAPVGLFLLGKNPDFRERTHQHRPDDLAARLVGRGLEVIQILPGDLLRLPVEIAHEHVAGSKSRFDRNLSFPMKTPRHGSSPPYGYGS